MSWLAPAAWMAACAPARPGLSGPPAERAVAEAVAASLERDPRRLALLVGPPGEAASRMAAAVAACLPAAWYPDPREPPDPPRRARELAGLVGDVCPGQGRPAVVLDGPVAEELHALLAALLAEPIHERLLVLVPESLAGARALAGRLGVPRTNLAMAVLDGAPEPAPAIEPEGFGIDALVPFALAPRRPLARVDGAARLCSAGLAATHEASETIVYLGGERWRQAVVSRLLAAPGGEARLLALIDRDPALAAPAVVTLARLLAPVPERLLDVALPGSCERLLALLDALPPQLAVHEALRGRLLLALRAALASPPGAPARAALEEHRADLAADPAEALAAIDAALAAGPGDERRRRLLVRRALRTRDDAEERRAREACRAGGDLDAEARLCAGRTARLLDDEPLAAPEAAAEWLAVEERRGDAAAVRVARAHLLTAEAQLGRWLAAIPLAETLVREHHAVGNVRRVVFFLHRLAALRRSTADRRGAEAALRDALALEEAIGYRVGQADCHALLGEIFRDDGQPEAAIPHLEAALAILAAEGRPVDAVRSVLEWVRGVVPSQAGDQPAPPVPEATGQA